MSTAPLADQRAEPARALAVLLERYQAVRARTERLAAPLSPEDQTAQSMPDVSPTKWHRAHTTWFFETFVLADADPGTPPFDPSYRTLFNSYYEAVGPQYSRPDRGVITRPGAAEVGRYRTVVDERMAAVLSGQRGAVADDIAALVELGLHHEQQHQELLLMDIKHVLSMNPTEPTYSRPSLSSTTPVASSAGWLDVEGGLIGIGHERTGFSFDNERPRHQVHLEPFQIADRLVTAGEWAAFIDDGGYERPELWLSDGWHLAREHGWRAPLYWRPDDDGWRIHTLAGTRSIREHEPVCHVSHYEADAYARWAGARLPTEAEWEHAVATSGWSDEPVPTDLHPAPATGRGLRQLTGACWQWTASAYLPYPGFAPAPGAVGEYNGKFMSGQMVLRGGSALTPPGHARPTYRNFFPPAARWPMTGVRLATGGAPRT